MTTDDDKQVPDPDPWEGLDAAAEDGEAEDTTFSFEAFSDPSVAEPVFAFPTDEPSEPEPFGASPEESPPGREVPLAVFPPADAVESDIDMQADAGGMEREPGADAPSGIIAFADESPPAAEEQAGSRVAAAADSPVADGFEAAADVDGFDDRLLAQELAAMDDEGTGTSSDEAAFGDLDVEPGAASEDVSFDTVGISSSSPSSDRSDDQAVDESAADGAREGDAVASIPLTAAVAAATMQATATPRRKKSSGLGMVLGVVGGGLLSLPVTYAILLWGLEKDPFRLGRHLPQSILPAAVRSGAKPIRKPGPEPVIDAGQSLDSLPGAAVTAPAEPASAAEAASEAPAVAIVADAGGPAKPEMAAGPAATAAADPESPAAAEPAPAESVAASVAVPVPGITPPPEITPPVPVEPPAAPAAPAPADVAAPDAAPLAATDTAVMPKENALARVDTVVEKQAAALLAASVVEPPPPLDRTAVDEATALVADALDALESHPAESGEGRDRLLVGWYRRLATLGEELVRLQTAAYDAGRPLEANPEAAAALLERISMSDRAIADLDMLGGMWVNSTNRRADGASLVADVVATRQVGPYWNTRMRVAGGNPDGSTREFSVISRTAPPVDPAVDPGIDAGALHGRDGDPSAGRVPVTGVPDTGVLITGVLLDDGVFWAAEIRPIAPPATAPAAEEGTEPEEPTAAESADSP